MNEVEALQSIANVLESIKYLLVGINTVLWLILFCKDCHGNNNKIADAIKELTNHLRSRR